MVDLNLMKPVTTTVGILVFDRVDLFDVTGPVEVFGYGGGDAGTIEVLLLTVKRDSLDFTTAPAIQMKADRTLWDAPELDAILVPGGPGLDEVLTRRDVHQWLRDQDRGDRWITSVCAGALLLGAAGLLAGHAATTHWASLPALRLFPEVFIAPGYPRTVMSGNRMTSGGVTSAFDLALALSAVMLGEQAGRDIELTLQYDPHPPYGVGRPDQADPVTMARVAKAFDEPIAGRVRIIRELLEHPSGE